MSLKNAIEALKNKDFSSARDIMATLDRAMFDMPHYLTKGLAELYIQDWTGALATFSEATGRFKEEAQLWLNRGIAEENLQKYDEAIASQEQSYALNPAQAEACGNLSNLYRRKGQFEKAEQMARHAIAAGAHKSDALNILGLALQAQGKVEAARAAYEQANEANPENPNFLANRANLEVDDLNFDIAFKFFGLARVIEDKPVFRHDEALVRMLAGDWQRGWELFEARLEMPGALRVKPLCPRWNGENLAGKKLLVVAEQGFGDVIQMSRYEKFLEGAELFWTVPSSLVRLLTGNVNGIVLDETTGLPDCDFYIPILSLPFATRQYEPQMLEKYFTAPQMPALPQGKRRRKIGLVWAGSRTHKRDYERSIPLKTLMPLVNEIPADFYAPFIGIALNEIVDMSVIRLDSLITDFADTASLLRQMDALITVDTAVAHLAGSMGLKTVILLPHCPDWRWGISGDRSEWYPTVTLARQETRGDWDSVVENLLESGF